MVSKVLIEARFGAIDQGTIQAFDSTYKAMRVRNSKVFRGHSAQFKDILIIDSKEEDLNFIICMPNKKGQITADTMHENIKNSMKTFQMDKKYEPGEIGVWLPQFKVGDFSKGEELLRDEPGIVNFKVKDSPDPVYIQQYKQMGALELFAPPVSESNLVFEVEKSDIVIKEEEMFVGVTISQLEDSGIDLPLCVTRVTPEFWRRA